VYYILHGDDEYSLNEQLAALRGKLAGGDEAMAQLNTSVLDGRRLTMGELRHATDAIPFLADRRLVIVHGLLGSLVLQKRGRGRDRDDAEEPGVQTEGLSAARKAFLDELSAYLPKLPETTRLVFVEDRSLEDSHPVVKLARAEKDPEKAYVRKFTLPKDWELATWIRRRVRDKGGDFSGEAITLLDALVGLDLRLLDQEIDKLLLYTDGRQVTGDDVRALVSRARQASIFDLVDHVGHRKADEALRLLHQMLEEEAEPLYLLAMLSRQVRILIQAKELQPQRLTPQQVASQLKLHPFVAKKGIEQAQNFDPDQLLAAHRLLVKTDWLIKTGQTEPELALDLLVVDLTRI
jgi:DNA polymerase-3 subunit delta